MPGGKGGKRKQQTLDANTPQLHSCKLLLINEIGGTPQTPNNVYKRDRRLVTKKDKL